MEWISVKDRLPNKGQTVLILWSNGVEIGRLPITEGEKQNCRERFGWLDCDIDFFILKEEVLLISESLYWLEIPESPSL